MPISQGEAHELAKAYTAAWNTGSPGAVAAFYSPTGSIVINSGEPWKERAGIAQMAAGFFADVPDLALVCDGVRCAGGHVVHLWTFTRTHAGRKNPLSVSGWEEVDRHAFAYSPARRPVRS